MAITSKTIWEADGSAAEERAHGAPGQALEIAERLDYWHRFALTLQPTDTVRDEIRSDLKGEGLWDDDDNPTALGVAVAAHLRAGNA